jgi:hypothetical protein
MINWTKMGIYKQLVDLELQQHWPNHATWVACGPQSRFGLPALRIQAGRCMEGVRR